MKRQYKHIHTLTDVERVYERKLPISKELQEKIDSFDWSILPFNRLTNDYNFNVNQGNTLTSSLCYNDVWNTATPAFIDELTSLVIQEFKQLDPSAIVKSILNLNLNLTNLDPSNKMTQMDVHSDSPEFRNDWTLLVHLKGNSGSTMMYDNMIFKNPVKEFTFEQGKVCIYPSIYAHSAILPNTAEDRIIARYIMEIDTVLNNRVRENLK